MRPIAKQTADSDQQLLFLPSIFNETMSMLFDAHSYFQSHGAIDQSIIDREDRTDYANEMTRITMRLTSVMAWIMVRRAIHAGRIDEEKAQEEYRLEAVDVCLENKPEVLAHMPSYMNHLSEKSLALFERTFRLDELAYGARH